MGLLQGGQGRQEPGPGEVTAGGWHPPGGGRLLGDDIISYFLSNVGLCGA